LIGYVPGDPVVLGVHGLWRVSSNMLRLVGHVSITPTGDFVVPSQLLVVEVLRRPLEFTHGALIAPKRRAEQVRGE